jgi:hypothetical protein
MKAYIELILEIQSTCYVGYFYIDDCIDLYFSFNYILNAIIYIFMEQIIRLVA